MTMAKKDISTVTPRLRFPEFREGGVWGHTPLGTLFSQRDEIGFVDLPLLSLMDKEGIIPQEESNRKNNSSSDKSRYLRVVPGDIAYNTMRMWEGRSAYVRIEGLISPAYTVCSPVDGTNSLFFSYYFKTWPLISQFHKYSQGLVKDTLNLKYENFQCIEIAYPRDAQEQQKIADCLTSLDEVIAAQGRKVEALKAHKRGFMQQLFPREGETRPQLRFPEFRGSPEWEERPLGEVIEVASGQVDPTELPYCDLPHVGGENIECETGNLAGLKAAREDGVISGKYLFDERDVLYSKIRPALNKVAAPEFRGICSADIYPIRPSNSDITRHFLVYLLRSPSFVQYATKHSARGKIPKINREALVAYAASLPKVAEQQRIVDSLSSLDDQIFAESGRLAVLKTHKQGLMQQLFPASEQTS
jgi:type I restriction enzyme S subunit